MLTSASLAFAHGGMAGPDELGQPLALSAAIAFVCYWAVVLWPSRKAKGGAQPNRKTPRRRNHRRIASGSGEARATSLRAVGRGSDG
jgi:hypothetical protein